MDEQEKCPDCGLLHPSPQDVAARLDELKRGRREPWGQDAKGRHVYTNGIMEGPLGLSPFIEGWGGDEGYYTDDRRGPGLHAVMQSYDWERVRRVSTEFDVPFNHDDSPYMLFDRRLLLGQRDWNMLMTLCLKSVPESVFDGFCKGLWDLREARLRPFSVRSWVGGPKLGHELIFLVHRAVNEAEAVAVAQRSWIDQKISFKWDKTRASPL